MEDRTMCRLCLNAISDDSFETLEDMKKGMLAVIVPEFNLDLEGNPNVICENCSKDLLSCYEFKSKCMENNWCLQNYDINAENSGNMCSSDKHSSVKQENVPKSYCLCLINIDEEFCGTEDPLLSMKLQKCMPELDSSLISKVCQKCQPFVDNLYSFVALCLSTENRINNYFSLKNSRPKKINLYKIYDYLQSISEDDRRSFIYAEQMDIIKTEMKFDGSPQTEVETETDQSLADIDEWKGAISIKISSSQRKKQLNCSNKLDRSNTKIKSDKMFKCNKCDFKTIHKYSMRRHFEVHKTVPGLQRWKCDFCSFTTRHKPTLSWHMDTHVESTQINMAKSGKLSSEVADEPEYTCKDCPFKTKFKQNLSWHMLKHKYETKVETLTCLECNFQTQYSSSFKAPLKKGHHHT